jgi:hypothetical protein
MTEAAVIGCETSTDPTCSVDITFSRTYSAGGLRTIVRM